MALLQDISPLHAEIIEGKYDEDINTLIQALNYRAKVVAHRSGIRPGAIVKLVDDPSAGVELAGKEARVDRVNAKSISITLLDESIPFHKRQWRVNRNLIAA